MSTDDDIGIIQVVLTRFNHMYLPGALSLKEQVDAGGRLSEQDIQFLSGILDNASKMMAVVDRHPEYQKLAAKIVSLYQHITEKALENEKQGD